MEKIKVVIVEDEFPIAEDIRMQLTQAGYEVTATFDNAEEARTRVLRETPDILLVDIRLAGKTDGIEFVQQLQGAVSLPFIYITANSDAVTYERARQTKPHSFLVKPFSIANLLASVDLALLNYSDARGAESIERTMPQPPEKETQFLVNENLFIRSAGKYRKVTSDDLLFVEADGSYVHVQTKGERYTLSQNLTTFQKKAPLRMLIRVHRSFAINITKVDSFDDAYLYIHNHKIPLSDNYKSDFLTRIKLL